MITAHHKDFIRILEKVSPKFHIMDVFSDFCAMAACSLEKPFSHCPEECEARYMTTFGKYTNEEAKKFPALLAVVMEALEDKRESFLGPVLEAIGAANVKNGQYLTPASVANVLAEINAEGVLETYREGELVRVNDPACGAGVMLIAGAEKLVAHGVKARDIYIEAGDIDGRACDITFVELTLLGYAAKIEHADALAMKRLSRPRWTVGYFLNGTQWRENRREEDRAAKVVEIKPHDPRGLQQTTFAL